MFIKDFKGGIPKEITGRILEKFLENCMTREIAWEIKSYRGIFGKISRKNPGRIIGKVLARFLGDTFRGMQKVNSRNGSTSNFKEFLGEF